MAAKTIHCLGIVVVDALSGPLARYPAPGVRTQVVTERVRFMAGGGAANTAAALGQMGLRASVFSKVGNDPNGAFLIGELKKQGVNTSGIVVSGRDTTPFTFVGVHPNGERTFIHTPGANKTFSRADLDQNRLFNADLLFYQDFWVLPKLDGRPAAQLLKEARRRGLVTVLDECWGLGPNRAKLELVLPFADYFLPSYDDLSAIYKGLDPNTMIKRLHDKGARKVILKMGKAGCVVSDGKKRRAIPACATKVVDTTGAGDCFDAGFIAGLTHGLADDESARIGCRAAAACIAHVGGAVGIPSFNKLRGL
jgi:sugar/nucleoside kinase (ribokinase family)